MSEKQATRDINTAVNVVYNSVKRKLEDRKTSIFILVIGMNIFLWGLLLAEYRQTNKELEDLTNKYELVQVYLSKVNK